MDRNTPPFLFLVIGLTALVTACGNEDRSQSVAIPAPERAVVLAGVVSGAPGELLFNRLPLQTGSALVTSQGRPASGARIRPGSVIHGTATKTAQGYQLQSADVRHEIEGTIERVELGASRLQVMGQTVRLEPFTNIGEEGPDERSTALQLADLKSGDRVEVDGCQAADGTVMATRIEVVPASPTREGLCHCVVETVNTAGKTAQAGGLTLAYGPARVVGALGTGKRVEVHGTLAGKTLRASWVKVEAGLESPADSVLELCGPISGFDPVGKTFQVMSYQVDYSRAKVEGTLANGTSVVAEAPLRMIQQTGGAVSRMKAKLGRPELRAWSVRV